MALFNKIAIIGVGLIGGSLARAIKKRHVSKTVVGYFRNKNKLKKAVRNRLIDGGCSSIEESIKDSDLIILALPINQILNFMAKIKKIKKDNAIIIDVGSTKSNVVAAAQRLNLNFVGTHPLAGSEKRGADFSSVELFENSNVLITPTKKTDKNSLIKIVQFWKKLNTKTFILSPKQHDKILASISHLPHVSSFCLMNSIPQKHLGFGATGLKDSTRIALSDAQIWTDIFLSNRVEIIRSIKSLENQIKKLEKFIKQNKRKQLFNFINSSKEKREEIE
ncbi:prephenate dehydrogenase [Candidatus Omnitrophota bacterium]